MVEFSGKTVLVTGGGSGIGEALAYEYARKGTNVLLTGRRVSALEKVAVKCKELGVNSWVHPVDLESQTSVDDLVAFIHKEGLQIDFFLLNAGVSQRCKALESDIDMDRKLMEVNYFGGVYLIKSLKDMLLASKSVHIAVVTSISGLFGFPLRSAYCASKHALHGFYESLALEYPHIKCTILVPGRIRTEISKSALLASGEAFGQMDPGQASGMPVEKCARIAMRAIERERHEKLIGGKELLMARLHRYCRPLYWFMAPKVSAH